MAYYPGVSQGYGVGSPYGVGATYGAPIGAYGSSYGGAYGSPYGASYGGACGGVPCGVQGGFIGGGYGAPGLTTSVVEQPVLVQQTQMTPPVTSVLGSAPIYQKPGLFPHRHHYPQNTYGPRYY